MLPSPQSSPRGERREFQHPFQREEYIRTEDRIFIATRHSRYSSVTLFFSLVLLFAGFHGASAETPGQPGTHPITTDSAPASTETNTTGKPSSSGAPRTRTTDSGVGASDASTLPGYQPDMSLTPPVHFTGPEPAKTPNTPAAPKKLRTDQAPQPAAQTETAERLGPQVDPCFFVKVAGDTWLDELHDYVQHNSCEPAVWFDTFFVKDHVLLDLRPGALIILRNSARWNEGHTVAYVQDFHIEWELPQWQNVLKRWKLYYNSRSVANKYTAQPGQPVQPGVNAQTGVSQPLIGVRADLYTRLRSLVSIDSGIKISLHPDAFVRMRYQYLKPFGEGYLIRFSEIAMWQAVEHFTNTVQLDFERKISAFTLVRWGNNLTHIEGIPGETWNSGISLFNQLTPKSAISYDTSMWGVSHPNWIIQNYRVGSLYRRNFYRPWLFFELAPEITLPKDVSGKRDYAYAFMATFEIQFGK